MPLDLWLALFISPLGGVCLALFEPLASLGGCLGPGGSPLTAARAAGRTISRLLPSLSCALAWGTRFQVPATAEYGLGAVVAPEVHGWLCAESLASLRLPLGQPQLPSPLGAGSLLTFLLLGCLYLPLLT